jgi:hypothetical protein
MGDGNPSKLIKKSPLPPNVIITGNKFHIGLDRLNSPARSKGIIYKGI